MRASKILLVAGAVVFAATALLVVVLARQDPYIYVTDATGSRKERTPLLLDAAVACVFGVVATALVVMAMLPFLYIRRAIARHEHPYRPVCSPDDTRA